MPCWFCGICQEHSDVRRWSGWCWLRCRSAVYEGRACRSFWYSSAHSRSLGSHLRIRRRASADQQWFGWNLRHWKAALCFPIRSALLRNHEQDHQSQRQQRGLAALALRRSFSPSETCPALSPSAASMRALSSYSPSHQWPEQCRLQQRCSSCAPGRLPDHPSRRLPCTALQKQAKTQQEKQERRIFWEEQIPTVNLHTGRKKTLHNTPAIEWIWQRYRVFPVMWKLFMNV